MEEHGYCNKRALSESEDSCWNEDEDETVCNFDERLLDLIKPHPSIYNSKVKEKENTVEIWKKISDELHSNEFECEARYKRLREYAAKERKRREDDPNSHKLGWSLYDKAQFLLPYISKKRYYKKLKLPKHDSSIDNSLDSTNKDVENLRMTDSSNAVTVPDAPNDITEATIKDNSGSVSYEPVEIVEDNSIGSYDYDLKENRSPINANNINCNEKQTDYVKDRAKEVETRLSTASELSISQTQTNSPGEMQNFYDEENDSLAQLVVTRLKKMKNEKKKDEFVRDLMNILFK